jgi:hypothetical protein
MNLHAFVVSIKIYLSRLLVFICRDFNYFKIATKVICVSIDSMSIIHNVFNSCKFNTKVCKSG